MKTRRGHCRECWKEGIIEIIPEPGDTQRYPFPELEGQDRLANFGNIGHFCGQGCYSKFRERHSCRA